MLGLSGRGLEGEDRCRKDGWCQAVNDLGEAPFVLEVKVCIGWVTDGEAVELVDNFTDFTVLFQLCWVRILPLHGFGGVLMLRISGVVLGMAGVAVANPRALAVFPLICPTGVIEGAPLCEAIE